MTTLQQCYNNYETNKNVSVDTSYAKNNKNKTEERANNRGRPKTRCKNFSKLFASQNLNTADMIAQDDGQVLRPSRSYTKICINNIKKKCPTVSVREELKSDENDDDSFPVIRLSLRKPKNWNLKLTTSASSPAIFLPIIHLVNEDGDVLIDTSGETTRLASRNSTFNDNNSMKYKKNNLIKNTNSSSNVAFSKNTDRKCEGIQSGSNLESKNPVSGREYGYYSFGANNSTFRSKTLPSIINQNRKQIGHYDNTTQVSDEIRKGNVIGWSEIKDSGVSDVTCCRGRFRHFERGKRYNARYSSETHVSSSSESENEFTKKRRVRKHRRKKGDRLLEINGRSPSSYQEAVEILKNGPEVVKLRFLRSFSNCRKEQHERAPNARSFPLRGRHCDPALSFEESKSMGSNVSRHSGKGLSGRRTQSSGNLCNGNKIVSQNVGKIFTPCSRGVCPNDRNKFCGSLPNHLDIKYSSGDGNSHAAFINGNNNNNNEERLPRMRSPEYVPVSSNEDKSKSKEVELRLHNLSKQQDICALQDQGYGSERSPEEEHLPPFHQQDTKVVHYPFINADTTFDVMLLKGNRGLGLSVTGGVDTTDQWAGLVRIKRLFPHQPAWQSGQLAQGDILLAANGVHLIGLTTCQALEVLRRTPNNVILTVCRPPGDIFLIPPPSEPPPPPRRDLTHSITAVPSHVPLLPLPPLQTELPCGEFDIELTKVSGSLGFTLRKEDESVLGHYVRALVKDPALSDGRIRPGDKIVAVNDIDISPMSHEEAVMFLRQCGDHVKLRLYRDSAQTPVSALSPSEESKPFRLKPLLRKEAMDMLSDLAVKKLSPGGDSSSSNHSRLRRISDGHSSSSPSSSPHRRRLAKTPSPDIQPLTRERIAQKYMVSGYTGNSDSSGEGSHDNTYQSSFDSMAVRGRGSSFASTTVGSEDGGQDPFPPPRPNFLDLCTGLTTPRKQKFAFPPSGNGWTSPEDLGTNVTLGIASQLNTSIDSEEVNGNEPFSQEPSSMPPLTNLSSTSSTSTAFSYRNPAYQSANPTCQRKKEGEEFGIGERSSEQDIPTKLLPSSEGPRGLLKWKGVVFTPENEIEDEMEEQDTPVLQLEDTENVSRDEIHKTPEVHERQEGDQVFMIELTRGWNSRMGFSLQADGKRHIVSAVYADSVAAKDGRIRPGDQILMVNDESVEQMSTTDVIDLLRKMRGTIGITILRRKGPQKSDS